MKDSQPSRKQFLAFGITAVGSAVIAATSCGSTTGTGGTGGTTGTGGGSGTGGAGTGGAGTGGAATGGAGTGGAATGGSNAGGAGHAGTGGGSATGGGAGGGGGNLCASALSADISGNHGHVFNVSVADIMAGAMKCYDVSGTAGHAHYITLMAADFATLRSGGVVKKFSCNGGDHQYVLSCAGGAPAAIAPPECTSQSQTEGSTHC